MKFLLFAFLLSVFVIASLHQSFGMVSPINDKDATMFALVGKAFTLQNRVANTHDHMVNASIEFAFQNAVGDNYFDSEKYAGQADVNKYFVAHQSYTPQKPGRFYINTIYNEGGTVTQDLPFEVIVSNQLSKATMNGCGPGFTVMLKPDYSKSVCVYDKSVDDLISRGWISD